MALHLQKRLDLIQSQVLPVAHGDKFIECAQQLKRVLKDLTLLQAFADATHHLSKKVKRIDVLENVRLTVGNQNHVELF